MVGLVPRKSRGREGDAHDFCEVALPEVVATSFNNIYIPGILSFILSRHLQPTSFLEPLLEHSRFNTASLLTPQTQHLIHARNIRSRDALTPHAHCLFGDCCWPCVGNIRPTYESQRQHQPQPLRHRPSKQQQRLP